MFVGVKLEKLERDRLGVFRFLDVKERKIRKRKKRRRRESYCINASVNVLNRFHRDSGLSSAGSRSISSLLRVLSRALESKVSVQEVTPSVLHESI